MGVVKGHDVVPGPGMCAWAGYDLEIKNVADKSFPDQLPWRATLTIRDHHGGGGEADRMEANAKTAQEALCAIADAWFQRSVETEEIILMPVSENVTDQY